MPRPTRWAGLIADAFVGAIPADSTPKFEGAVRISVVTRLGAEATANADCRRAGVIADANAGVNFAYST